MPRRPLEFPPRADPGILPGRPMLKLAVAARVTGPTTIGAGVAHWAGSGYWFPDTPQS
jgi:hypothetical protein